MTFRFYAEKRLWADRIGIGIGEIRPGDPRVTHVVTDMTFVPIAERDHAGEPSLSLRPSEAQELMDELWRVGVRPSSGEGNAGQLGATKAHLEDMRTLVFKGERNGGRDV
jgi:hypothetical protein